MNKNEKEIKRINLYLEKEVYDKIKEISDFGKMSMTKYLKLMIDEHLTQTNKSIIFEKGLEKELKGTRDDLRKYGTLLKIKNIVSPDVENKIDDVTKIINKIVTRS